MGVRAGMRLRSRACRHATWGPTLGRCSALSAGRIAHRRGCSLQVSSQCTGAQLVRAWRRPAPCSAAPAPLDRVGVRNSRAVHPTSMDAPSLHLSHPVRGFRRLSLGMLCCLCLRAAPPAQLHAHRDFSTRRHPGRSSSRPEPMHCSPQEPHLLVCSCQLCASGSAADHHLLKAGPCLHTNPRIDRLHSTIRPWRSMNMVAVAAWPPLLLSLQGAGASMTLRRGRFDSVMSCSYFLSVN